MGEDVYRIGEGRMDRRRVRISGRFSAFIDSPSKSLKMAGERSTCSLRMSLVGEELSFTIVCFPTR